MLKKVLLGRGLALATANFIFRMNLIIARTSGLLQQIYKINMKPPDCAAVMEHLKNKTIYNLKNRKMIEKVIHFTSQSHINKRRESKYPSLSRMNEKETLASEISRI